MSESPSPRSLKSCSQWEPDSPRWTPRAPRRSIHHQQSCTSNIWWWIIFNHLSVRRFLLDHLSLWSCRVPPTSWFERLRFFLQKWHFHYNTWARLKCQNVTVCSLKTTCIRCWWFCKSRGGLVPGSEEVGVAEDIWALAHVHVLKNSIMWYHVISFKFS